MESAEKKKSPDSQRRRRDARYVFLSSTQSAISRTPTSGETMNESVAREVVVGTKAKRPKKQKNVIIKEDADDEYR